MGRKNVLAPFKLNGATPQSLAASFNSAPTLVKNADNIAYQVNVTTTDSTGSFAVQASLDYSIDETTNTVLNAGNWITLTLAGGTPIVNAANTQILIDLNELPFNAVRLAYTAGTAGTGVCDMFIMTKQIGG